MIHYIHTARARKVIRFRIQTDRPMTITLRAQDPCRPFCHYTRRLLHFDKRHLNDKGNPEREISISLPVSPPVLQLDLRGYSTGNFSLHELQSQDLADSKAWASETQHRFMRFAIDFAQKAGHAPHGFYSDPEEEFLLHYLPLIRDEDGSALFTPARIHRQMPRVQLSARMFRRYSIPVRVAILAHEGCHYFLNTRDETEADLCGLGYYLAEGFPKIEAVYAATKIFTQVAGSAGPEQLERTRAIIKFINQYPKTD